MNLTFDNSFVVMPRHCNYHYPMIFGGHFFSEMDLCAATCVNRLLHDSECDSAVTFKFDGTFHAPAESGDIIFLHAEIIELRRNAIVVAIEAHREHRAQPQRDHVASAKFVFVSRKDGKYYPHGLKLR